LLSPIHAVEVTDNGVEDAQEAKDEFTGDLDESSLLMEESEEIWSRERCVAFLEFAVRHAHHLGQEPKANPTGMSCDAQRNELQKIFAKAYVTVKDLETDAKERSEDETCFETAETTRASELVPLVAQRDAAVSKIEYSEQSIAALEPVLTLVMDRTDKLRAHIDGTLSPECQEATDVSKYLALVRELILSLEECPGRNDFKLKIPEPTKQVWYSVSRSRPIEREAECPASRQGLTWKEKLDQQNCRKLGGIVKLCGNQDRVRCSKTILYETTFGTPESPDLPCTSCKRGLSQSEQTAKTRCEKKGGEVTLCGCYKVFCSVRVFLAIKEPRSHVVKPMSIK